MLLFLFLNMVASAGSGLLSFRFFPQARTGLRTFLVYTFFIFLSAVIGLPMLLGMVGQLQIGKLSLLVVVFGILAAVCGAKFFIKNYREMACRVSWKLFIPFAFLGIFLFVEFWNGLLQPVWEYDSLAYHMPFVRHWLEAGSIWKAIFTPYTGPVGYYPGSGEMLTLWHVLPLGSDLLANIPNVFLAIIFAVASYDFGRRLGWSVWPSLLVPMLFLHSPLILKEIGTPHVDLFFALGFLYVLYFLFEYMRDGENRLLVLLGLAFGLFGGSKYLALPYAGLIFLFGLFFLIKNFVHNSGVRKTGIFALLTGFIGFFITGGFWYVRNFFLTGNPVFPAEVKIGSSVIFAGYGNMTEEILNWSLIKNLDSLQKIANFLKQYFLRSGWHMLLIPLAFLLGILFFKKLPRRPALLFLVTIPLFFYLYLATPYTFNDLDANIRYSLPFLLVGAWGIAFLIEHIKKLRPFFYGAGFLALIVTLSTALKTPDFPHELMNFRLLSQFPWGGSITEFRKANKWNILEHKYPAKAPLIHAFLWLEEHVAPDTAVAYSGFHFHAPLFGTDLRRNVQYISVNDCIDCNYFEFQKRGGSLFTNASQKMWLKNLDDADIWYIILYDQIGYLKYEPEWIKGGGNVFFEKKFDEGPVKIYLKTYAI